MKDSRLNAQRIFSDPPLMGSAPIDLKFAPDGSFVSYRRAAEDDRERMDLWRVELASGEHSLWIDARTLSDPDLEPGADVHALTDAERAERERRRQFSFGINEYHWHPDGNHLLLPFDGQALLIDVSSEDHEPRRVCPANTRQSGFQLSPTGKFLSYVRDGDLYFTEVDARIETRLTSDASETVENGLPDFLAAEEMHRFTGHWWSKDEQYLVFCKVDNSPVRISYRLEMQASGVNTVAQRYPYAGETNPKVELWLVEVASGECSRIWQDGPLDAYLARINMGAEELVMQTTDRLQQRLRISSYNMENNTWQQRFEETSASWINLTDDLRLLDDGRILFTSEQSGTRRALILNIDGETAELSGPTHIKAILDVVQDTVYVSGWDETPIENHLFAISLSGAPCQRLTTAPGWHDVVVDAKQERYLDRASSELKPVSVHVCELSGEKTRLEIYTENIVDGHPYAPYLARHSYAEFGEIHAEDGQRLCYRLTPPAEITGKHATIVYVYGGPGPQQVTRTWSPLTVQLFAQHGFGVLELDNRGSGNRGRRFESPLYKNMGTVEVIDQVRGLRVLDDYSWADKSRVGVFGHSYGGYMTLMCLSQASEHFCAGVAVAPVCDWRIYDSHYAERFMGLPQDNTEAYRQAAVLPHLHKLSAPLLLMHGMADDNVLFTHSTMIMAELQKLGTPFELMTYPGAKHSMQERDVSIHRFNMIVDFFTRHLSPAIFPTLSEG